MKKSIATLLVAILALGTISTYAATLSISDSAATIKTETTKAMKARDMSSIVELLSHIGEASSKQQTVILGAIQNALNTSTLKKFADDAVTALNAGGNVVITKAAGGKWNITIKATDTTTGSVIKEDIPKAAVEKPTLSTDPTVNKR